MAAISQYSEDDISSVMDLNSIVRQNIKNIINNEEFTTYKLSVKTHSTDGGSYFGNLHKVTVIGTTKNGENKVLNVFIKSLRRALENFSTFSVPKMYQREEFIYKNLFKYFKTIEDKYNIPQEERLKTVKVYSETNNEAIILEDIARKGYKTYDRSEVVPLKYAEFAIEQLAKIHAVSFVMRKEDPEYFEHNIKSLDFFFQSNSENEEFFRKTHKIALETLEDDAKIRFDKYYSTMKENFLKSITDINDGVCIVHGDYRPSNILVKEIDGVPSAVIPVDYQLANFGNPIMDFIFFIFLGTDQKFRKDHMDDLKELYYCTFEKFLSMFDIDATEVYSKKQFEEQLREKMGFGLMFFLIFMNLIFASADNIPEMENGLENMGNSLDVRYKDRLRGIVDDLIQWGYF